MRNKEEMAESRAKLQMKLRNQENKVKTTYEKSKICPKCGSIMKYVYGETFECPACGTKELSDFGKVRAFLDDKGPQPAIIIAEATGVRVDIIEEFLREGRVEIPDGSDVYIHCQSCGTDIRYGRYCPECMARLAKQFNKAIYTGEMGEKPHRSSMAGKMHLTERALGDRRGFESRGHEGKEHEKSTEGVVDKAHRK